MEEYSNGLIIFISALIPTLITLWLNEKVKGSVKNSFDEKLAQFQIDLNHLKAKENFKFTKLHEKRFEVLQKTYQYVNENINVLGRLVSMYKEVPDGISEIENEKKLRSNFDNSYDQFKNYYNINLIFFSEEIELLLNKYFEVSRLINTKYFIAEEINENYSNEFQVNVKSFSIDATKLIIEELIPIKKQIEIKFRTLLGE